MREGKTKMVLLLLMAFCAPLTVKAQENVTVSIGDVSGSYGTSFATTTKSECERPTNLTANAVGDMTYATLSWSENGAATAWVLQYDTDYYFSNPTEVEVTTGFVVEGTHVSYTLTGLSEQTYYARVKPACDTEGELWSNTINFVPYYTILPVNNTNFTRVTDVPIWGYNVANLVYSQFVIPSGSLETLIGSTVKRFTFHTNNYSATPNWGDAQFEVYITEVDYTKFSNSQFVEWTSMTQVYSGSLVVNSDKKMIVTLDNDFMYEGGNLLIGFKQTVAGTSSSVNWWGEAPSSGGVQKHFF